ncbi:MAG: RHS repeat-associated core domain-containing protein, partial [Candidatus Omnitrophica bacterium]|nr:RHS repeat-associated core domain-containing protein [Candidatus Omnitrophota bacterium]
TGRRLDVETGLYYYRNRYYSPLFGRFITRDPAGIINGPNLYAYCSNNPVNFVDPWGLCGGKGENNLQGSREFQMDMWLGGSVGHIIFGGGVYNVTILDLQTGEITLYTIKAVGIGVSLPSFRGSSKSIKFSMSDPNITSKSFEGYGYLGGASVEVIGGIKIGGGIKVPNGPFIPGDMIGLDYGGVDIGVSHNITHWKRED